MLLKERFIELRIEILKVMTLLVFLITAAFLFCHLFIFDTPHKYKMIFADIVILIASLIILKYMNSSNYKYFAIFEFFIILFSLTILSILYPQNYYIPIWMFGALIVFILCTNKKLGFIFLILTMTIFDFIFFKRLDTYTFMTLNMQFISYFIFGVVLIDKLNNLQKKTLVYENMLYEDSIKDCLTHIYNRNYFEKTVDFLLKKAKQNKKKVLFFIIDIDYFKKINDTYGHPIGDLVLVEVANIIKRNLKENDIFARIGGEEFAVFIEDYKDDPIKLAEKIRKAVEESIIKIENKIIKVTVSIGGVVSDKYDYNYLYKKADENLYEAKKERNKTVITYL